MAGVHDGGLAPRRADGPAVSRVSPTEWATAAIFVALATLACYFAR